MANNKWSLGSATGHNANTMFYEGEAVAQFYGLPMHTRVSEIEVSGRDKEGFERAAFVVRAVNSHEALIKALETARSQLITLGGNPNPEVKDSDKIQAAVLMTVDAALSQAKESAS